MEIPNVEQIIPAKQLSVEKFIELDEARKTKGQSIESFCAEQQISKSVYYNRQRKATKPTSIAKTNHSGWVQVKESISPSKTTLVVEIGGCRLEVTQATDAELLVKTCRVLKSI